MDEVTIEMFLNWNGEKDTNTDYLSSLVVEILNNNDDTHLNELREAILKANK